jgi:arginine decarboxylase
LNRQLRAPLYESLIQHLNGKPISFHVPGHKMGQGFDPEALEYYSSILKLDQTEIDGLDDLHSPHGAIMEAQQLAAEWVGADHTFFLVNGSTSGNLAMIQAVCRRGDIVLVQRNVHKSMIHALILAGARPVFIPPRIDRYTGIAAGLDAHNIEKALMHYPEARAVVLTHPNYYGMGSDLEGICAVAHRFDVPVLVDEAHGAHYGQHPKYPRTAIQQGADAAVQSTHKMGASMTMGAWIHVQGKRIDLEKMRWYLSVFQSSSPSYPIMASIDLSRRFFYARGSAILEQGLHMSNEVRESLKENEAYYLPNPENSNNSYESLDPLKLTIHIRNNLSGFTLKDKLQAAGCFMELADVRHVLAVLGPGTERKDGERLAQQLILISKQLKTTEKQEDISFITNNIYNEKMYQAVMEPLDVLWHRPKRRISLKDAVQNISGEMIIPYPPGIPLIHIGERWTRELVDKVTQLKQQGARFHGMIDPSLDEVMVVTT